MISKLLLYLNFVKKLIKKKVPSLIGKIIKTYKKERKTQF